MPLMRYLQLDHPTLPHLPRAGWFSAKLAGSYLLYIILIELAVLLQWPDFAWVRLLALVGGLTLVVYIAHFGGRRQAMMAALLVTLYLLYRLSTPNQLFHYTTSIGRAIIVFSITNVVAGFLMGRLSDRFRMASHRELQATKNAEDHRRQLETILEELPVGVLIIDAFDQHISYSNSQAEQLLGIGLDPTIHSDDLPEMLSRGGELTNSGWPLSDSLRHPAGPVEEEVHYTRIDGQSADLRITSAPVFNRSGQAIAAMATVTDISLAKELEQRKDEFISIASHELKTPVTSLKIYLQLLEKQLDQLDRPQQLELIAKANAQVVKLSTLMADLLDVSRLQSNKTTYHVGQHDMMALVREVVDSVSASTDQLIRVEGAAERLVYCDYSKIQQVVSNLLSNAIKYSQQQGEIVVRVGQTSRQTKVAVIDQGIGISVEDRQRIFDMFYQAEGAKKSARGGGLGIGLYVSQQIINHHSGTIRVESKLGHGSTFEIVLPNLRPVSADD